MMDHNHKTPDQLVDFINSNQNLSQFRVDYYKKILFSCYSDYSFKNMIDTMNFKDVRQMEKNKHMYMFVIKTYNNNNVIVGSLNDDSNLLLSDLSELSIPVTHYHLSKNNFVQDHFFHKILNNENKSTKKFIERIRLIDEKIKQLISDYIKNIDTTSPISELLKKNNVTYDKNWIYTGIISKTNDTEYINLRYFKESFKKENKIGTKVYCENKFSHELDDLLSRNTNCYIHGNVYPIVKIGCVIVNERVIDGKPMVNFTCKAYFVDINFAFVYCGIKKS